MNEDLILQIISMIHAEHIAPIGEAVYEAVKDLNDVQLSMLLGTVVDRWAARHKKSQQETFEILKHLSAVQKEIHKKEGPFPNEEAPQE